MDDRQHRIEAALDALRLRLHQAQDAAVDAESALDRLLELLADATPN